ncbi:hypothetical protein BC829DRAFT_385610 [Chytridium lagenaria]|nr:hypothetical protein BC829DRAFT_385610 [Chytridium lagenaria]
MLASSLISLAALTVAFTSSSVSAAARLEQPDGTIILAGWLDTDVQQPEGGDSFTLFNQRIGRRAGAFQLPKRFPHSSPWLLFLTDLIHYLADQVYNITQVGRNVYIRYLRMQEMMLCGQPAAFIESFRRISTAIHARTHRCRHGIRYVDFVGLSVYLRGEREYPWIKTGLCPDNFSRKSLMDLEDRPTFSFYDTYSRNWAALSEGAAAYHIDTRLRIRPITLHRRNTRAVSKMFVPPNTSFWNTFLFNSTFRAATPRQDVNLFEFQKNENELGTIIHRDFRPRGTRNRLQRSSTVGCLMPDYLAKAVSRPTSDEYLWPVVVTSSTSVAATKTGGAAQGVKGLGLFKAVNKYLMVSFSCVE